ncbi:MAG TPA: flavoprotein, partial [Anaerolineales bacterium]|nr:flavoprotein [Anaerolineales bacterium]
MDTTVIDAIVGRVIERLAERRIASAPSCRVLMLFSGASTGYVAGLKAIRMLSGAGHPLHVVLSASALHVIGEDNLRKAGATKLSNPDTWLDAPRTIRESDVVLVPTLSMNTAAHLALGLMDSLLTTLIL